MRLLLQRHAPGLVWLNRFLGVAAILVLVGVGGLWIYSYFQSRDVRQVLYKAPATSALPQQGDTRSSSELTQPREDTSDYIDVLKAVLSEDELATPEVQKLINIIESPAYGAFVATNPHRLGDIFDFFQSQGLPVDKNEISEVFEKLAPVGYRNELAQQMREELSARLIERNIVPNSDAGLTAFQTVITEFLAEKENIGWMMTHFQGDYMAFGEWAANVLRNPTPPPEDPHVGVNFKPSLSIDSKADTEASTPSLDAIVIDEMLSIEGPVETFAENDQHIDDERLEASTPNVPELASEENLETALRTQFSPERLNRAMKTLTQYGPEEGLRRLKDSDPEVAKQVEEFLPKQQEND